jgi:hypothetical protein
VGVKFRKEKKEITKMEARIEDGKLVIELPLEKPRPSSTGKTLLVATTRGVQRTTARLRGKTISIVVNAFIPRDGAVSGQREKSAWEQRHEREGTEEDDE